MINQIKTKNQFSFDISAVCITQKKNQKLCAAERKLKWARNIFLILILNQLFIKSYFEMWKYLSTVLQFASKL